MAINILGATFADVAQRLGDEIAVIAEHDRLTYRDLAVYSERIGDYLSHVLGKGQGPVAIWLPPGIDYIAALIATQRQDTIFCPLQTSWPIARVRAIIDEVRPSAIITNSEMRLRKSEVHHGNGTRKMPVLIVNGPAQEIRLIGVERPDDSGIRWPRQSSYIMYTSGSTGRPKGILGRADSVLEFVKWEIAQYELGVASRIPQLAPVGFDVSLRDIFAPLLAGGAVCVPPGSISKNPILLSEWLGRIGATAIHIVPSLLRVLLREAGDALKGSGAADTLRRLLVAGEPLYMHDVREVASVLGTHVGITNLYGPSETTLAKCYYDVAAEDHVDGIVPLGRPLPGTSISVEDTDADGTGIIVVTTTNGSHGYFPPPGPGDASTIFTAGDGSPQKMSFRTGDWGRLDGDGILHYCGRKDEMVKVRGNRVELLEVEACLGAAVDSQIAVCAEGDALGNNVLHCFYVESANNGDKAKELRARAERELPDYMHPETYNALREVPVTANGKVDKRRLLEMRTSTADVATVTADITEDPLVESIARAWADVLDLASVPLDVPFQSLGGSSLRAMQVIARLYKKYRAALRVTDLRGTVLDLATIVRQHDQGASEGEREHVARNSSIPLSPYQRLMWDVAQDPAASLAYHEYVAFELRQQLDLDIVNEVARRLAERHEILRTAFVEGNPPRQVVQPALALAVECIDMRQTLNKKWQNDFLSVCREPFDLGRPPLFRCRLYRLADNRYILGVVSFHIIVDLHSIDVLVRDAIQLYVACSENTEDNLPSLSHQYSTFAKTAADEGRRQSRTKAEFWKGYLPHPLPELSLSQRPRPFMRTFEGASIDFDHGAQVSAKLRSLAQANNISEYITLLTAYGLTLQGMAISDEPIIVGCPVSLRDAPNAEQQVGLYLNAIPVVLDFRKLETLSDALQHTSENFLAALEHKEAPLQEIAQVVGAPIKPSRAALYDTIFTITERPADAPPIIRLPRQYAKLDLMLNVSLREGRLEAQLEFNTVILEHKEADQLANAFQQTIEAFAEGRYPGLPPATPVHASLTGA